ncbi:MAG: DUF5817 domain-containing protein [Haloferacaceae archaeon]
MYAVVGCNECGNVWLLSDPDDAETARCSRCGKRHQVRKLRRFHESADREAARQVRSAMLARKGGASDAYADLDSVADMERQLEEAGVDDAEFLAGSGLDPDEVAAAGERASGGRSGSQSRDEIVREAVEAAAEPTESAIVAYAAERGVPEQAARDLLEKLRRRGEVSESRGEYRLL